MIRKKCKLIFPTLLISFECIPEKLYIPFLTFGLEREWQEFTKFKGFFRHSLLDDGIDVFTPDAGERGMNFLLFVFDR